MDRLLRPGAFFVLSGPPVNWVGKEKEFEVLQELIQNKLCYTAIVVEDRTAIWQKPRNASCWRARNNQVPPLCEDDNSNDAWLVTLRDPKVSNLGECLHV